MKLTETWRRYFAQLREEQFHLCLLTVVALIVALITAAFGINLHRNFITIACDTAASQNTMANILDGRWFRDTAYDGPNLLGLHSTFILLPLALVYALYPSTNLLFVLQIFGVWSSVIPLYLVVVKLLEKPATAFLVAIIALTSPLFLEMAWAPFHPESWILAAALWSVLFYLQNRSIAFWISMAFALCCGEQAGLIYASLGASWLFFDDGREWRKRYGLQALTAGLGWIAFTAGLLVPWMHHPGQRNLVAYNYANWGVSSFPQLAAQICSRPAETLFLWLSPGRWVHLFGLIGIPLLLALVERRTLLLLAPFFLYFLMDDQEFFLYFHAYYFQFAFLAGFLALAGFLVRRPLSARITVAVLTATLLVNVLSTCETAGFYLGFELGLDSTFNDTLHNVFDQIPVQAGVYAPHRFSAYLSNRVNMVMGDLRDPHLDFNAMLEAQAATTDVRPDQIDYIVSDLINDQCGWRQSGYNEQLSKQRAGNISKLIQSGQWTVFWTQDNVYVLQRKR